MCALLDRITGLEAALFAAFKNKFVIISIEPIQLGEIWAKKEGHEKSRALIGVKVI
jgi:hypothetical protein